MKKFLIIGNINANTHKEIFPLIKENKIWLGPSITGGNRRFDVPDDYPLNAATCGVDSDGVHFIRVKDARWFTNLGHQKRNAPIDLHKKYNADEYQKYDNYDAINVDKVKDIPVDYDGVMGVPITFLDKYCPSQFEIIGCFNNFKECDYESGFICGSPIEYKLKSGEVRTYKSPFVNGVPKYKRILIKRKASV